MNVYDEIDKMATRVTPGVDPITANRINLYSSGLKAKLKNSEYAFLKLNELAIESNSSISTSGFATGDIIHFYLDSFFAFLYSSFDVMAQIINQKLSLNIDEHNVSFKKAKQELDRQYTGIRTQQLFDKITRSRFFKNLEKYRNCSTHRRQIYIQSRTTQISGTPGYTTSGDLTRIERIICDDPLILVPTVNKNRELIAYCSSMLERTKSELSKIIKCL